jgi:hypothetical protein
MLSMNNALLWITVANVLYLASYSVHDILWLRILSVIAATLLIPYYMIQPVPLTAAIAWNAVFIAINVYWIVRLILERRPVHFTPDEARLRELSFPSLTPREARDLFACGAWEEIAPGASLVEYDKKNGRFSVILHGLADVLYESAKIAELGEGQFVGGLDLCADVTPDFDVLVRERVRVMCWPRVRLEAFVAKRPDVELALERSVGLQLQDMLNTALSQKSAI